MFDFVDYVLGGVVLLIIALVLILLVAVILQPAKVGCDSTDPTAGQIVDCIATRTAEARHK